MESAKMSEYRILQGYARHDIISLLPNSNQLIGVELGVADGEFSRRMVDSGKFSHFFGVDMYADTHDTDQYKRALRHVGLMKPYKLLRLKFDEAYDLFDDQSLDFIYIDGYAHSGQEGGETIWRWSRKVKVGGLIAGDDFHADWPLVIEAVSLFAKEMASELMVTSETEPNINYAAYPSWALIKNKSFWGEPPAELVRRGKYRASVVASKRIIGYSLRLLLKTIIGQDKFSKLRKWSKAYKQQKSLGGKK